MTENEAQKWLERFEWDGSEETSEALATICEALQEYPKFRAIGTIDEFKALKKEVELYRNLDKTNFSDGYNKAVDEFVEKLITNVDSFQAEINGYEADVLTIDYFMDFVNEIAEQLKAGGKNE
jgi:hypothetical protein